jgi:hypothetical protein
MLLVPTSLIWAVSYFYLMSTTKALQVHSEDTNNSLSVFINIHDKITLSFKDETSGELETVFCFEDDEDIRIFIAELNNLNIQLYGTTRKK